MEAGSAQDGVPQLVFQPGDVRNRIDVQLIVGVCLERFGRLDVFVANAGIDIGGSLLIMDESTWEEVLDVNLTGAFLCTQAAARAMVSARAGGGGRIVLVASTNRSGLSRTWRPTTRLRRV